MIINQRTGESESFYIRCLAVADLPIIEEMQQEVIHAVTVQDQLQPLTTEEFLFILNGRGLMVGAFTEEKLIGFRALLIPPLDEEHLGRDFGLPDEELPRVLYQELSAVLPAYRGNRLQQQMARIVMEQVPNLEGDFRYIACTVAPMNIPSMKDKIAQGMHIAALKEKYSSMLRYIFVKDLEQEQVEYTGHIAVPAEDLERQQELLTDNYVGVGITPANGSFSLDFAKRSMEDGSAEE
ncbi:hypothetical protein B0X71_02075 [Planococcus lenghuensis]|uniref:N-acetyltransferase domain-containing protein n=2 Tax=Planococcus lenghuensis TaxID=2213202 RepID=A0A1Q2L3B3_9BACL|nr:hypothetical protein B0X71_02075 [Planococcus lenghuensis]